MKKKLIIVVLLLIVFDQLTKWLAQAKLPFHEAVEVVPLFSLYLTYNKGIAFSFLSGLGSAPLIVLTLAILVFMIVLWRRVPPGQQLASLGFALVIAGAVGNLTDRISQGHVIDFFLFHTQNWAFAVFNVADAYITIGAVFIVLDELIAMRQKKTREEKQAATDGPA